jgi:hypothetical protein
MSEFHFFKIFFKDKYYMKTFYSYSDLLNEASGPESRIEDLAKDPKTHKALGTSDEGKLKHAFMVLFKRGYGAAQTNWAAVNPNIKKLGKPAAYNAWGYARLNAFIKKTKGYETTDSDVADWLNGKGEKPEPN